jgi:transcriptional regulator
MYIRPPHREEDTTKILEFIRNNEFATLVTFDGEKPIATHILLSAEQTESGEVFLEGHLARANAQWKFFDESKEVLAVFFGAHAYLSPTWYEKPDESVPTWNYVSAHVYGTPHIVEDRTELLELMRKLVGKYESDSGYRLENLPPDYLEKQLKGIVGFRIRVTKIEASFKLAQTLDSRSYENVIIELEKHKDENSKRIAGAMSERVENERVKN